MPSLSLRPKWGICYMRKGKKKLLPKEGDVWGIYNDAKKIAWQGSCNWARDSKLLFPNMHSLLEEYDEARSLTPYSCTL